MALTEAQARKIALSFPGAHEKASHGTPAIFVGKKLLAQIGCREPDTIMLPMGSFEARDHLIAADPRTFYITEHFKTYKGLVARRAELDAMTFRVVLERRWQAIAPKALQKDVAAKTAKR
ncbi:MAG TPA: hypothetical protein VNU97_17765 [Rhizomicrobium sp.]|jgi:hypothetical protein|nr:hypothetical protein [Rhizomicrobium sp.]